MRVSTQVHSSRLLKSKIVYYRSQKIILLPCSSTLGQDPIVVKAVGHLVYLIRIMKDHLQIIINEIANTLFFHLMMPQ